MTRSRCLVSALLALGAAVLAAPGLGAQGPAGGRCDLVVDQAGRFNSVAVDAAGQVRNSYVGGGFVARCAGQDVRLRADSAESYGASNVLYLIGNVRYSEPRVRVDANRMTYFQNDERLLMEGNVVAVLPTGTTMRGPQADYYRAVAGLRPRQRLVAPGRPTVTLVETDTVGKRGEPTRIVANLITMDGDSLVYATGSVEITRTDLEARGDSAFMDSGREFARLMRGPRIVGKQRRPFTLEGTVIDLHSRRRQLERVVSMRSARATSEDMRLDSDTIDMRMSADTADNTVERVYVWGASRARAVSADRDILADSLDVRMPRQRLTAVHAIGDAFVQTAPDTLRIRNAQERDWMRGDTIIARFDTAAPPAPPAPPSQPASRAAADRDTASRPRLQRVEATVDARAFYQAASQRGADQPPSLCYSRGQQIVLTFANNEAQRVTVTRGDSTIADGVCLEPAVDSLAGRPGARPAPPATAPAARGTAPTTTPAGTPPARPASRPPTTPVRRP